MARLPHLHRHSLPLSNSDDIATSLGSSTSTPRDTPPPPQPRAILEYPNDVLDCATPVLVSTSSESRPFVLDTGPANVEDSGPLDSSPNSTSTQSPPSSSDFHELLSLLLVAAAADGQASAAAEILDFAHGRASPTFSDDFIAGSQCASDVASEDIRTDSTRSDESYDTQDWFDLSESSMEDDTSEAGAPSPSEGYLPLFDEGWDPDALEDMTSSWVVFDTKTGQDGRATLQREADVKIISNLPPVLASSQVSHAKIIANTPAVSSDSPESVSSEVDELRESDGPESDEETDGLPTSNVEPMEVENHADNATTVVRDAMDSVMFELVTEQLFCLQAGYAHDGVIENCQAALQRLLRESGYVSAMNS